MNSDTLARFCTRRIGRADSDVPNRPVNTDYRGRQAHYPWGNYEGTCIHSEKQVSDCPSDCSSKEYYNEEEGKCLLRAGLKTEEINDSSEGLTGAATSEIRGKSSTGTIILIIFLVLIGGSVAYYIYSKKSKKELSRKVKQEVGLRKGKFCKKCDTKLKPQSKFCSKCGKKV